MDFKKSRSDNMIVDQRVIDSVVSVEFSSQDMMFVLVGLVVLELCAVFAWLKWGVKSG